MRGVWLSEGLKAGVLIHQAAQNVAGLFWGLHCEQLPQRHWGVWEEFCSGGDFTHFWLQTTQVLSGFHLSWGCHSAGLWIWSEMQLLNCARQLSALSSAGTSPSLVNLSSSAVLLPAIALLLASFWTKFPLSFVDLFNGEIALAESHLLTLPFLCVSFLFLCSLTWFWWITWLLLVLFRVAFDLGWPLALWPQNGVQLTIYN